MITFRPAVRTQTPLMIGLAGPSRAGKTYSALRVATGLAQGKPIAFIDTERGRGLQYAEKFRYSHGELQPPFSAERYAEAIRDAVNTKPAVVIVDSFSHLHEGPGGILEQHDKELDRMAGDDWKRREKLTFSAWIKPKASVTKLVNEILQTPVHFIFCFRAKNKLKIVKGAEPVHLGWTPIITDRFEYECSLLLVLPEGSRGTPDLDAVSSGLRDPFQEFIVPGVQLDEQLGQRFAEWAAGGARLDAGPAPTLYARQQALFKRLQPLAGDETGAWLKRLTAHFGAECRSLKGIPEALLDSIEPLTDAELCEIAVQREPGAEG